MYIDFVYEYEYIYIYMYHKFIIIYTIIKNFNKLFLHSIAFKILARKHIIM